MGGTLLYSRMYFKTFTSAPYQRDGDYAFCSTDENGNGFDNVIKWMKSIPYLDQHVYSLH